jgi:glycosyltransferase involved in cell wall biosynthesis
MIPKDRLKIAILDHSPDLGGAEVALLTLLRNIDRSRFDVTVIVPSSGTFSKALEASSIPVSIIHLPMRLVRLKRGKAFQSFLSLLASLFSLQVFILNLCIYLKRNRFQLVLTNTIKSHLCGSVAARLCSIPLVWRFHDILVSPDFNPFLIKFIVLFGNSLPKKILAVSKATQHHLIRNGIEKEKTEVIFNAIDDELFQIKESFKDIRKEYHLENTVKLVGCIGRIIPQKGQKVLLSAIPGVIRSYPEIFFLIIGDVFLKEEGYKNELLEFINKNGIEERVKFTGYRSDIVNVMGSLDIVVFPSIAPEAFGLSVLEAMSLGKPVIASNIGGVKEIIEDGVTGVLVDPNHPDQITEKILCLFNDPRIYDGIGQRAREFVKTKFSLKDYVLNMEEACLNAALREEKFEDRDHP